jgi:hypothetical protein
MDALFAPVRAHDREVVPRGPREKARPSLGLDDSHPAFSCDLDVVGRLTGEVDSWGV